MSAAATPLLVAQDLAKRYQMGGETITALAKVSLELPAAGFLGICGPSGSGKSTLLNILGMLDDPDDGYVEFEGRKVDYRDTRRLEEIRQRKIGFIFQHYNLIPVLDAQENVEIALINHGFPKRTVTKLAREALCAVGLADRFSHYPRQLSGGQQQRVAVARALVKKPALILADEPTANLDSANAYHLIELMARLNREYGSAFLVSTHDQRMLAHLPRVIRLQDGVVGS